jgi:hypothetical protein
MTVMKLRVRSFKFVQAGLYRGSKGKEKRPYGRPEGPNRYGKCEKLQIHTISVVIMVHNEFGESHQEDTFPGVLHLVELHSDVSGWSGVTVNVEVCLV